MLAHSDSSHHKARLLFSNTRLQNMLFAFGLLGSQMRMERQSACKQTGIPTKWKQKGRLSSAGQQRSLARSNALIRKSETEVG